jgi:hypothetical protein
MSAGFSSQNDNMILFCCSFFEKVCWVVTKNKIIFSLVMFAYSFVSSNQGHIILRAGYNNSYVAQQNGDYFYIKNKLWNPKLYYGMGLEFFAIEDFYFESGIFYSEKGLTKGNKDSFSNLKLDYIEIPLLGRKLFGVENKSYFVTTGIYGAILWTSQSRRRDLDAGVILGTGFYSNNFIFDVQYVLGMVNLVPTVNYGSQPQAYNHVIRMSAGYKFVWAP